MIAPILTTASIRLALAVPKEIINCKIKSLSDSQSAKIDMYMLNRQKKFFIELEKAKYG